MGVDPTDVQWLSLAGDLRRRVALASLLAAGDGRSELVIFASQVEHVDAVGGAAMRVRIARHLREHPAGQVMINPPPGSAGKHLLELLTPLPDGVTVIDQPAIPDPPRFALVPGTLIVDAASAVDAAGYTLKACEHSRISDVRANLAAAAVAELSDNALRHPTNNDDHPAVAVTVTGRERILEVAVVDLGTGISAADSPSDLLAALPGPSNGGGFLSDLIRRGNRRNINVSVEVMSGTANLHWTWDRHRTTPHGYVPGTTVVARIPS